MAVKKKEILKERGGVRYFPELDLPHGFSTLKLGNMSMMWGTADEVSADIRRFRAQVPGLSLIKRAHIMHSHGGAVEVIERYASSTDTMTILECDGLVTNVPYLTLSLYPADCLPIIIADSLSHDGPTAIALVYAGRKGTEEHVTVTAVEKMHERFNCLPDDLMVFIGPGIDACCNNIDLIELNISQLVFAGGVKARNIRMAEECTCCTREPNGGFRYFSYKRSQQSGEKEGRFIAAVALSV